VTESLRRRRLPPSSTRTSGPAWWVPPLLLPPSLFDGLFLAWCLARLDGNREGLRLLHRLVLVAPASLTREHDTNCQWPGVQAGPGCRCIILGQAYGKCRRNTWRDWMDPLCWPAGSFHASTSITQPISMYALCLSLVWLRLQILPTYFLILLVQQCTVCRVT
jgi:hypothetical protein